jgi:hypothetical protein
VENHSCHTDFPAEYGYNPAVLAAAGSADPAAVAMARGAAYTSFLEHAVQRVRAAGKRLRPTLNLDWFRPAESRPRRRRLAFPGDMVYPWQEWLDRGLGDDGVVLRPFATPFDGLFGSDPVAQEMIERCRRRHAPITVNRYVWRDETLLDRYQRLAADGRFSGMVLYETWSYTRIGHDGWWRLAGPDAPPDPHEDPATAATRDQTADYVRTVLQHHRH